MATVSTLPSTDPALVHHTTRPNDEVTAHGAASAFKAHPHHTSLWTVNIGIIKATCTTIS